MSARRRCPPRLPAELLALVCRAGFGERGLRDWCAAAGVSESTIYVYRSRGQKISARTAAKLLAVAADTSLTAAELRIAFAIPYRRLGDA